jgi:purine-binding chemotaxis protein CheW
MTSPPVVEGHGPSLTFELGGEEYAFPVMRVQEVLELVPVTRVPSTPPYVLGVIDVRGRMVPVVDLAAKLGLGTVSPTRRSCIVLVEVEVEVESGPGRSLVLVGVLVDAVHGLVELTPEHEAASGPDSEMPGRWWRQLSRGEGAPARLVDIDFALRGDAGQGVEGSGYNESFPGNSERHGVSPEDR